MFCCDTRDLPAIDKRKLVHIPGMTVKETKEVRRIVPHMRIIRSFKNANGKICIPFLNGIFGKVEATYTEYFDDEKDGQ